MVVAARSTDKTQSNVRAKLLFLGGLIAQGNEKAEKALEVQYMRSLGDATDKTGNREGEREARARGTNSVHPVLFFTLQFLATRQGLCGVGLISWLSISRQKN